MTMKEKESITMADSLCQQPLPYSPHHHIALELGQRLLLYSDTRRIYIIHWTLELNSAQSQRSVFSHGVTKVCVHVPCGPMWSPTAHTGGGQSTIPTSSSLPTHLLPVSVSTPYSAGGCGGDDITMYGGHAQGGHLICTQ